MIKKTLIVVAISMFAMCSYAQSRKGYSRKPSTTKTVKKNPPSVSEASGTENGIDFVDLGLSVKWATKNLGASMNTQVGGEYLWGNPNKQQKGVYKEDKNLEASYPQGNGTMKLSQDAAHKELGGNWRIPTIAEFEELNSRCSWSWVKGVGNDGKSYNGYIITGPNGNSIFMPRPVCHCKEYEECNTFYMASTYSKDAFFNGDRFCVEKDSHYTHSYGIGFGYFVRAVCK